MVVLHHIGGVGEKEVGVGLEMDDAVVDEEAAVALHEVRRCQPLAGVLHLGVAERQPYFLHFARGKEAVDNLDVGTQESHVSKSLLQSLCGSRPHAGSLDVDTYEVHVGIALG